MLGSRTPSFLYHSPCSLIPILFPNSPPSSRCLFVWILHKRENTEYFSWLIFFLTIFQFPSIFLQGTEFHLQMNTTPFAFLYIHSHISHFFLLSCWQASKQIPYGLTVTSAATYMDVHVSLWYVGSFSNIPRSSRAGSYGRSIFS